jgi:GntR family transcriptional repressor for pyruvate dehydrogenase complex
VSFSPVHRRSLIDAVVDQLVAGIVSGDLPAGEPLPAERRLAEALGVSRPAVREALQRLAQSRLVDVRQGDGTTVADYRRTAGPELLPHLLVRDGQFDPAVARSIVEVRALLGPGAARMAAERGPAGLADDLDAISTPLTATDDPVERQRIALAWWDRVVDAADNLTLRLLFNALRGAYEPALGALATVLAREVAQVDRYREVAAAVRDGDGAAAEAAADALLQTGTTAVLAALDTLDATP